MNMDFELPALRRKEIVALKLRALYEKQGYRLFRMGSFEEYDLYMQNKPFLMGDDIITFTAADGRLMALKPDVTLSIVKNTPENETRKVFYSENVFRRSRQAGEYREIAQMGIEYIGQDMAKQEEEVLLLAAQTLMVIGRGAMDLSHMDVIDAVLAPFGAGAPRGEALAALRDKSPHGMRRAAESAGLDEALSERLAAFASLSGGYEETIGSAQALAAALPGVAAPLEELAGQCRTLAARAEGIRVRVDFSILNDTDYYNGIIFQGYLDGAPQMVLGGGRYDNLLRRFGKPQGAIGFALHLDALGADTQESNQAGGRPDADARPWLNVALPKGRMGDKVYELFEQAGFSCPEIREKSRKLVFEDEGSRVRYFLVKPGDVDIYVEHGAADIGVAGKDVLMESGADVLELLDLGLGKCKLAVAGMNGFAEDPARTLRVASKYPRVARAYYAAKSRSVEIIKLHGSIELAPILGLSDVIVDIVETGSTLKENNLAVFEDVAPSSARLIANRASWRFKEDVIRTLVQRLQPLLG